MLNLHHQKQIEICFLSCFNFCIENSKLLLSGSVSQGCRFLYFVDAIYFALLSNLPKLGIQKLPCFPNIMRSFCFAWRNFVKKCLFYRKLYLLTLDEKACCFFHIYLMQFFSQLLQLKLLDKAFYYWKRLLFQQLLPFLQTRTEKSFLFITRVYGRRIHGSGSEGPNAGACNLVPTGEYVSTDDWAFATDLIPWLWQNPVIAYFLRVPSIMTSFCGVHPSKLLYYGFTYISSIFTMTLSFVCVWVFILYLKIAFMTQA